ncbi:monocarboxylate transporter 13-like [Amblyraja radiata]|uniref:monocarboxylate transporter 13-like n=1 Tax=Amblyraja radiata TaxID=386614 RepID=UPI001402D792|nr:monocarboxylate transporter 13-like [Amblyraja radiata]
MFLCFDVSMLTGPLGSAFGKRYGARPVVMVGGILASLGMFVASFGQSLLHLYLSIGLLTGLGWALVFTPTMAMISRYFDKRRALATGLAFTGVGIASFFFSPLFRLLIDAYTWRGALRVLSAILLNLCVCAALLRPIRLLEDLPAPGLADKASGCWEKVTSALDLGLLRQRAFMVYTLALTLMTTGYFVPYVHLVAHGKNLGFTDYEAALILSLTSIPDTVARMFSGWLSDLKLVRSIHLLFLWSVLSGISLFLLPLGRTFPTLMAAGLFYGLCAGGLSPLFFSTLPDIVGVGRILNATGLFLMLLSVGGLLGPPLSGLLEDRTGSYNTSFMVSGGFNLAGSLALLLLPGFFARSSTASGQRPGATASRRHGAPRDAQENDQSRAHQPEAGAGQRHQLGNRTDRFWKAAGKLPAAR